MAIQRPPKSTLKQELGQETSLETTILTQLDALSRSVNDVKESQTSIKDGQKSLKVMLFGGTDNDIPHPGRVTTIEKQQEVHEARISSLEDDRLRLKTVAAVGAAVGGVTATVATILIKIIAALFGR